MKQRKRIPLTYNDLLKMDFEPVCIAKGYGKSKKDIPAVVTVLRSSLPVYEYNRGVWLSTPGECRFFNSDNSLEEDNITVYPIDTYLDEYTNREADIWVVGRNHLGSPTCVMPMEHICTNCNYVIAASSINNIAENREFQNFYSSAKYGAKQVFVFSLADCFLDKAAADKAVTMFAYRSKPDGVVLDENYFVLANALGLF